MRRLLTVIISLLTFATIPAKAVSDFVPEAQMKADLLQMLADFTTSGARTLWPTTNGACGLMPTSE